MDYSSVKEAVRTCPELGGLDSTTLAELFWIAKERKAARGYLVYKQGEVLDGSFYLLLDGKLTVWINGGLIADVSGPTLIGEGAFAAISHNRGATLQVTSDSATLLEFHPSEEMLAGPLNKLFAELAWDRWLECTRMQPS